MTNTKIKRTIQVGLVGQFTSPNPKRQRKYGGRFCVKLFQIFRLTWTPKFWFLWMTWLPRTVPPLSDQRATWKLNIHRTSKNTEVSSAVTKSQIQYKKKMISRFKAWLLTQQCFHVCFLLWPELIWRSWKESVGQGWGCGYFCRPGAALRHAKLQSRLEVRHTNTIPSEVGQTNGGSKGNAETRGRSQTLRVR